MANILIIEDNLMNLEMAGELLERAGHGVIRSECAVEGIKQAKFKNPDLILMDLNLPEMDGLTATKILKQDPLTSNIPVIAFTALVMKSDREKAFGAGCCGFIPKPIDVATFAQTVEEYLKDKSFSKSESNQESFLNQSFNLETPDQIQEKTNYSKFKWHKILIIDDNPMNAELLKETLEQIGQSSVIAYSGKQALEIVKTEKFDLILLDIMMPEMSGFEVIEQLKSNPKTDEIPVIFISALSETSDIVKGLELGSYEYITKPYNIEELKARILSTLRIKDLQDQLKTEKNKLDLVFNFSADGIVMLNSSREIISCNNKFLELVEKPETEVISNKFCNVINCQHIDLETCVEIRSSLENDKRFMREITLGKDNKTIQINSSIINPLQWEAEGYVMVLRDISAYKEIEKQKETFVATLTHDLKTPIRAEIMAMELLLKGSFGNLNPDQADIIQDTLHSSKYMFNMVDNLLSTYRYENGNISLKKDSIDIHNIIKICFNELKYLIEEKSQELYFDFGSEELFIFADMLEIKRVIMNLLSNAISYTHEGGNITIRTGYDNDEIKISFVDNGKGLSEEDISRIFNKYTSYAKKFRQVGTGLGLYLSKQIIESHNGRISVESIEGEGSTFSFYLPVTRNASLIG